MNEYRKYFLVWEDEHQPVAMCFSNLDDTLNQYNNICCMGLDCRILKLNDETDMYEEYIA